MGDFHSGEGSLRGGHKQPRCTFYEESRAHNVHRLYDVALDRVEHAIKADHRVDLDKVAWRSNCHLERFDTAAALADATVALDAAAPADQQVYTHCLLRKADALYHQGQFEEALTLYHQGAALRPNHRGFTKGVKNARQAILNSLGKLSKTHFLDLVELMPAMESSSRPLVEHEQESEQDTSSPSPRMSFDINENQDLQVRRVLGPMMKDKTFVKKVMTTHGYQDSLKTDLSKDGGEKLIRGFEELSGFFNARQEFWRLEKPLYARQCERALNNLRLEVKLEQERAFKRDRMERKRDNMRRHLQKSLQIMDDMYRTKHWDSLLNTGKELIKFIQPKSNRVLLNKLEYLSVTYSYMTHALMNLDKYDEATACNDELLTVAQETKKDSVIALAYATIGRTHARFGNFRLATNNWEAMIPHVTDQEKKAWLFHELSRCYYELNKVEVARMYAGWSHDAAVASNSTSWRHRANLLIAKTESKLGDHDAAVAALIDAECDLADDDDAKVEEQETIGEVRNLVGVMKALGMQRRRSMFRQANERPARDQKATNKPRDRMST